MIKQSTKTAQSRKSFTLDFNRQAIDLANEIRSVPQEVEKLGIKISLTFAAWVRQNKKISINSAHEELLGIKEEDKRLKKELEKEKKVTAILRDAAAFFVMRTRSEVPGNCPPWGGRLFYSALL